MRELGRTGDATTNKLYLACCVAPRGLNFVRHHDNRRSIAGCFDEHRVEHCASLCVQTRMRFIEQQQLSVRDERARKCHAPALTRRTATESHSGNVFDRAALHRTGDSSEPMARRTRCELEVLAHREVLVSERIVPHHRDPAPNRVAMCAEVQPKNLGDTAVDALQTSDRPEQRRLPGAVGTGNKDNLSSGHIERSPGESRKGSEEGDHVAQANGLWISWGGHAGCSAPTGIWSAAKCTKAPATRSNRVRRRRHPSGAPGPYPGQMRDFRMILEWVGRTLLVAGLVILGFVAYQLWGTGLLADRSQANLRSQFNERTASSSSTTPTTAGGATTTRPATTTTPVVNPPSGDAIAVIKIERIDLESTVVNGVSTADLRKGPGRYPQTVLPGERGNAALAGHRTTYGAPFGRLDELRVGDPIVIRTLNGTYTYRVSTEPFVVSPRDVEVLDPTDDTVLTLTTCHPKYSAAERLIVRARLDTDASPTPRPPSPTTPGQPIETVDDLAGSSVPVFPLVMSGLLLLLVGGGWWFVFHRRPHWTTWVGGFALFLPALLLFYYFVERSLPASY